MFHVSSPFFPPLTINGVQKLQVNNADRPTRRIVWMKEFLPPVNHLFNFKSALKSGLHLIEPLKKLKFNFMCFFSSLFQLAYWLTWQQRLLFRFLRWTTQKTKGWRSVSVCKLCSRNVPGTIRMSQSIFIPRLIRRVFDLSDHSRGLIDHSRYF